MGAVTWEMKIKIKKHTESPNDASKTRRLGSVLGSWRSAVGAVTWGLKTIK
jgi:hypothetical protein